MKKNIILIFITVLSVLACNNYIVKADENKSAFETVQIESMGKDVEQLQQLLNYLADNYEMPEWECGNVDGEFGVKTEEALKTFQKDQELEVNGVCGPKTWNKLFSLVS